MRIDPDATLYEITESWPETVAVFTRQGFPQMAREELRRSFGSRISLRQALALKKLDLDGFVEQLEATIGSEAPVAADTAPTRVVGLLPCPVRIPLLEAFEPFIEAYQQRTGRKVEYELQAASMGAAWIDENLKGVSREEDLPELFISAGFETFFDPKGLGRFRDVFYDGLPYEEFNESFDGVDLRDPEGRYSVISVVPAVFMVNMNELGDQPVPQSWEDLLDPRFEQRVSLPVGDFDLFSAILIEIHRRYGEDAVRRLGRSLAASMHPSQMIKLGRKSSAPIVTIMPYFFTRMAKEGGPMKAVWPRDGAIISPIFLLARKSAARQVQPLIDFFASREIAEILAHKGLFPSTRPDVDNRLAPGSRFGWPGWEFIRQQDIAGLIERCQQLFEEGRES
ncbi:MAG: ABC transporter substrate-binding protein [Acidobacteriota bacterium]|nr:ABC transporter substrate-binding protein [Acidobacteriota bacterium]